MLPPPMINLGSLVREKLTQDEIDRLQFYDPDALRALDRAIVETPMTDEQRKTLRDMIQHVLANG